MTNEQKINEALDEAGFKQYSGPLWRHENGMILNMDGVETMNLLLWKMFREGVRHNQDEVKKVLNIHER